MNHRRTVALVASLCFAACAPRARSPDCDAMVNRCIAGCAGEPERIQPREQVVATGRTTSVPQSACEQRCSNKCK